MLGSTKLQPPMLRRLLLRPHHLGPGEARQLGHQRLGGERIELLDAQQVDVVDAARLALREEVVVDLAAASTKRRIGVGLELDLLARARLRILLHYAVEGGAGAGDRQAPRDALVAQQRLRRHQDQRLAEPAAQLPAQEWK